MAETPTLDRATLRARLRKLRPHDIYRMLDRAIEPMSDAALLALVRGYFKTDDLEKPVSTSPAFPETVRAFAASSLKGEYFQSFDEGDDIIFFADEPGAWQVDVPWSDVLPVWFKCVSMAEGPDTYARRVREVITEFVDADYEHKAYLSRAIKIATPEQARSLTECDKDHPLRMEK